MSNICTNSRTYGRLLYSLRKEMVVILMEIRESIQLHNMYVPINLFMYNADADCYRVNVYRKDTHNKLQAPK